LRQSKKLVDPEVSVAERQARQRAEGSCSFTSNPPMQKKGILFFGSTEILIGSVTLAANALCLTMHTCVKPLNVLLFVVTSSVISVSLGAGVLLRRKYARKFLIFFAGWIILSKVLIFAKILFLCCELETTLPTSLKNIVSIAYHIAVILYFHQPVIKAEFER